MSHGGTVSTRMLRRRCQRVETGRGEAMDHRGTGFGVNALSRMSTRWRRVTAVRWTAGTNGFCTSALSRCKRMEPGRGGAMGHQGIWRGAPL